MAPAILSENQAANKIKDNFKSAIYAIPKLNLTNGKNRSKENRQG
jgi:hypothetical protein